MPGGSFRLTRRYIMPWNGRKRRVPGNSVCLPTKLKSRSAVDLITSGVDVSGVGEYCRPKPSTKTATIIESNATIADFHDNFIARARLVVSRNRKKEKRNNRYSFPGLFYNVQLRHRCLFDNLQVQLIKIFKKRGMTPVV